MFGAAGLTDDVVRGAAGGSQTELGCVIEAMEPQVRLMVAARLSPTPSQHHAAEDLVQQVLLALTAGLSRLERRTVDGLKAFASGIVSNQVAMLLRQKRRANDAGPQGRLRSLDSVATAVTGGAALWQLLSGGGASPKTLVARTEQAARLMDELGRLKGEHREVITLSFFDQLPMRKIAQEMNVSRPAASMLLIRAVRALRERMLRIEGTGTGER